MALVEWRDDFKIGIDSVDYEHRQMIELINAVHEKLSEDAPKNHILDFLGEVFTRISAHFALEEKIMRSWQYDHYEDHKADHERLLDEIRDIMDGFEAGSIAAAEAELSARLNSWFADHFKTKDARLHRHLGV
jgi:hemerythrin